MGFSGRGEMIPNDDCYCELDPKVKDKWGIPVLRFHWKWSEHETRQAAHMQKTFAEIIEAMGGRVKGAAITDGAKAIDPGGKIIHEVGGAIMGADAEELRHEPVVPDLGREESLRHRRRAVFAPTPTRIPRSRSWRSPGVPRITFSLACAARSSEMPAMTPTRLDRRTLVKWMLAVRRCSAGVEGHRASFGKGYGTDPVPARLFARRSMAAHPERAQRGAPPCCAT